MHRTYLEFTELFSRLSPYQLNHLSEVLLCKIESNFEGRSKNRLMEKDIEYALTEAMRDISVDLRERQLSNDHLRLNQARAKMLSHKKAA